MTNSHPSAASTAMYFKRVALLALTFTLAACAPVTPPDTHATGPLTIQQNEVARNLYEIAYSEKQAAVFVAAAGSGKVEPIEPARIYRLDPLTLDVQARIDLPHMATGLALDDDNDRLYAGSPLDGSVSVLDTAGNKRLTTLQLARPSTGTQAATPYPRKIRKLLADAGNQRLYALAADLNDSALYVVDTRTLRLENVVAGLGAFATGITLDASTDRLYISNMEGQIITLDAKTQQRLHQYPAHADQPLNLTFDPARGYLILTDQGWPDMQKIQQTEIPGFVSQGTGNRVVVLEAKTGRLVNSASVAEGPLALHLDAARGYLYVTHRRAGTVSVLDSRTLALLHSYALPEHPNSLALDASHGALFVTVKNDMTQGRQANETVVRIPIAH